MAVQGARSATVPKESRLPGQVMARAVARMNAGDHRAAIAILLSIRQHIRKNDVASNMLAYLCLSVGDNDAAVRCFKTALKCRPDSPEAWSGLGFASQLLGNVSEAIAAFDQALSLRQTHAEDWYNRSVLLTEVGQSNQARSDLEQAIELKPDYALALNRRARMNEETGRFAEALSDREYLCTLTPQDPVNWTERGNLLYRARRVNEAISSFTQAIACAPSHFAAWINLATVLKDAGRAEDARTAIMRALDIDNQASEAQLLRGNIEQDLGNEEIARSIFAKLAEGGPIKCYPAATKPPQFRVLLVFSPLAGNTPYEDLISGAAYECRVVLFMPGCTCDRRLFSCDSDIIVNLISDADCGRTVLEALQGQLEGCNLPVINPPHRVTRTDRQSVAEILSDIDDCIMSKTRRLMLTNASASEVWDEFTSSFPIIVRTAGTHGGENMELVADRCQLQQYVNSHTATDLYVTQFVDYQSIDGYYRKYRFVFVGEHILSYHLAIGDGWKVHHATTRMAENEWMRAEEQSFLNSPGRFFPDRTMQALQAIKSRIGLDYFGIDCSVNSAGQLVVFEVNSSMLIHLRNDGFEYKTPHVMRIKQGFDSLLGTRVKTS